MSKTTEPLRKCPVCDDRCIVTDYGWTPAGEDYACPKLDEPWHVGTNIYFHRNEHKPPEQA